MDIVAFIKDKIARFFADNNTNDITEAMLREVTNDMVDNFSTAVEIKRLALLTLCGANAMRPGVYKITDVGDAGIFVRALDASRIALNATGVFLNPDFQNVNGNNVGVWNSGLAGLVANVSIAIWNDFHFINLTGVAGTSPDGDLINWRIINKPDESYVTEADAIEYDVVTQTILRRRDKRGNNISSDTSHFQWGNDMVTWNTDSDVASWGINNNRGYIIGNSLNKAVLLRADEKNVGNIIGNQFSGSGNVTCNLDGGVSIFGCMLDTELAIEFDSTVTLFEKRIENKTSDIEKEYDVTGLAYVELGVDDNYIGVVKLISDNATETINEIKGLPEGRVIRICPNPALAVSFATGGFNKMLNGASFYVDGAVGSWIEFEKRGGVVYNTNSGKY